MTERKVIGKLNQYWECRMKELALQYKYPFADIKEICINPETGEISVIVLDIDDIAQTKDEYEAYV